MAPTNHFSACPHEMTPELVFRALLTQDGTQPLELARA
jgi:hypothetical protein